jgi:hypothetical protein
MQMFSVGNLLVPEPIVLPVILLPSKAIMTMILSRYRDKKITEQLQPMRKTRDDCPSKISNISELKREHPKLPW